MPCQSLLLVIPEILNRCIFHSVVLRLTFVLNLKKKKNGAGVEVRTKVCCKLHLYLHRLFNSTNLPAIIYSYLTWGLLLQVKTVKLEANQVVGELVHGQYDLSSASPTHFLSQKKRSSDKLRQVSSKGMSWQKMLSSASTALQTSHIKSANAVAKWSSSTHWREPQAVCFSRSHRVLSVYRL